MAEHQDTRVALERSSTRLARHFSARRKPGARPPGVHEDADGHRCDQVAELDEAPFTVLFADDDEVESDPGPELRFEELRGEEALALRAAGQSGVLDRTRPGTSRLARRFKTRRSGAARPPDGRSLDPDAELDEAPFAVLFADEDDEPESDPGPELVFEELPGEDALAVRTAARRGVFDLTPPRTPPPARRFRARRRVIARIRGVHAPADGDSFDQDPDLDEAPVSPDTVAVPAALTVAVATPVITPAPAPTPTRAEVVAAMRAALVSQLHVARRTVRRSAGGVVGAGLGAALGAMLWGSSPAAIVAPPGAAPAPSVARAHAPPKPKPTAAPPQRAAVSPSRGASMVGSAGPASPLNEVDVKKLLDSIEAATRPVPRTRSGDRRPPHHSGRGR